jgi:hypothetical protein
MTLQNNRITFAYLPFYSQAAGPRGQLTWCAVLPGCLPVPDLHSSTSSARLLPGPSAQAAQDRRVAIPRGMGVGFGSSCKI